MTEAPVSFNVKALSPAGFDVMLTIRGEDSAELMPRALKALEWLQAQGFSPTNGHTPARAAESNGNDAAPVCPTHGKPMKASQYGGWYCPEKIAEDGGDGKPVYCRQKVK